MELISVVIRSDTRVRLQFSSQVDSTAFTGTGDITIESLDGIGVDPDIQQRLQVLNSPQAMELVLSFPIAEGGLYQITLDSIPSTDFSTASGTQKFKIGESFETINSELETPDIEKILFGVDLVWTGEDYLESTDGDLATISGKSNLKGALTRRLMSEGLTWDDVYGVKPREFVDGPNTQIPILRGTILRQMLSDDRVKTATVKLDTNETDNIDESRYVLDVEPIGSSNDNSFAISIPVDI